MSLRMGECSWKGPVLREWIRAIEEVKRFGNGVEVKEDEDEVEERV